jgi:hypothetical protein
MGREVKRVALDFAWPLGTIWGGFKNPFYCQCINCPDCEGSGSSPAARELEDKWYGYVPFRPEDRGSVPFTPEHPRVLALARRNAVGVYAVRMEAERLCRHYNGSWCHHLNADDVAALVKAERLHDLTKDFVPGKGWQPKEPAHTPTPQEVNDWSIGGGIGHDAINQWTVVGAECERLGLPTTCARCEGEGSLWPSAEIKQAAEDWKDTEPPAGEGWQVWETVSEGSPITPVMSTREALIDYLVQNGDLWDQKGHEGGWKRDAAERFVAAEWAPSGMTVGGQFYTSRDLPASG